MRIIGLMSGTSIDGIDAALVRFVGDVASLDWDLEEFRSTPYPSDRKKTIHDAIAHGSPATLSDLNVQLGEWFAEAALDLCDAAGLTAAAIDAIGSHGHTVWHRPPTAGHRGATLQLGCAATIAERTGITVISDFRSRDVAAGGHGAPLVPFADRLLYARPDAVRVLVNIGGMANLTRVPRRGDDEPLLAFDTGPGNALIDAAVEMATGGEAGYDRDGRLAAGGSVDGALLGELLEDPFYAKEPPRSTGRETYGRERVERLVAERATMDDAGWRDFVATLTELTARTIADAVRRFVAPRGLDEVVVTGGGAHNPVLMRRLSESLAPLRVVTGTQAGIHGDAKEAIAFAALAWAHLTGRPGNVPEVTGAVGPRILGSRTPGRMEA